MTLTTGPLRSCSNELQGEWPCRPALRRGGYVGITRRSPAASSLRFAPRAGVVKPATRDSSLATRHQSDSHGPPHNMALREGIPAGRGRRKGIRRQRPQPCSGAPQGWNIAPHGRGGTPGPCGAAPQPCGGAPQGCNRSPQPCNAAPQGREAAPQPRGTAPQPRGAATPPPSAIAQYARRATPRRRGAARPAG